MRQLMSRPTVPLLTLAGVLVFLLALAWAPQASAFVVCGNNVCEPNGQPFGEDCETCPQDCGGSCSICGNGFCTSPETCSSCSQDCGTCPNQTDSDGDGVTDDVDNCIYTANANQADCDGDGTGDVCDDVNADYQPSYGPVLCAVSGYTYRDSSSVDGQYETLYTDVSSCNSPDRWYAAYNSYHYCSWTSDVYTCCNAWFNGCYTYLYSWQCHF